MVHHRQTAPEIFDRHAAALVVDGIQGAGTLPLNLHGVKAVANASSRRKAMATRNC